MVSTKNRWTPCREQEGSGRCVGQTLTNDVQHLLFNHTGLQGDEARVAGDLIGNILTGPVAFEQGNSVITKRGQSFDLRSHPKTRGVIHNHGQVHGIGGKHRQSGKGLFRPPQRRASVFSAVHMRVFFLQIAQVSLDRPQIDIQALPSHPLANGCTAQRVFLAGKNSQNQVLTK